MIFLPSLSDHMGSICVLDESRRRLLEAFGNLASDKYIQSLSNCALILNQRVSRHKHKSPGLLTCIICHWRICKVTRVPDLQISFNDAGRLPRDS